VRQFVSRVFLDKQRNESPDRAVVESGVFSTHEGIDILGRNAGELVNQSPLDVR
jgi:hypothetical protein